MEQVTKSHAIKLKPTKIQVALINQSFGVARHSYNWALEKWNELYKEGKKIGAYGLVKLQNSIKKAEFPFYLEVSKTAPQYAIHNVESAFKRFFDKKANYPKFKKKGRCVESFVAVESDFQFKKKDYKILLPRIGWVNCCENLRFEGKVNNVVVKKISNQYFAIVNIETPKSVPIVKQHSLGDNQATVGIDFGISNYMVCSDGTVYHNPRALKANIGKLNRLQRGLSKKVVGSENFKKHKSILSKKYHRISNIRKNAIHKATTEIVRKYDKIVIEDLNVKGMMRNHNLAQAISDVSFGEARRQLTYKCKWEGKELVIADRWYPSSKICSNCGNKKAVLSLSQRVYNCDLCGFKCDRDLNSAKNLVKYDPTHRLGGSEACGGGSSVVLKQHSPSMNQEISFIKMQDSCTNLKV